MDQNVYIGEIENERHSNVADMYEEKGRMIRGGKDEMIMDNIHYR